MSHAPARALSPTLTPASNVRRGENGGGVRCSLSGSAVDGTCSPRRMALALGRPLTWQEDRRP